MTISLTLPNSNIQNISDFIKEIELHQSELVKTIKVLNSNLPDYELFLSCTVKHIRRLAHLCNQSQSIGKQPEKLTSFYITYLGYFRNAIEFLNKELQLLQCYDWEFKEENIPNSFQKTSFLEYKEDSLFQIIFIYGIQSLYYMVDFCKKKPNIPELDSTFNQVYKEGFEVLKLYVETIEEKLPSSPPGWKFQENYDFQLTNILNCLADICLSVHEDFQVLNLVWKYLIKSCSKYRSAALAENIKIRPLIEHLCSKVSSNINILESYYKEPDENRDEKQIFRTGTVLIRFYTSHLASLIMFVLPLVDRCDKSAAIDRISSCVLYSTKTLFWIAEKSSTPEVEKNVRFILIPCIDNNITTRLLCALGSESLEVLNNIIHFQEYSHSVATTEENILTDQLSDEDLDIAKLLTLLSILRNAALMPPKLQRNIFPSLFPSIEASPSCLFNSFWGFVDRLEYLMVDFKGDSQNHNYIYEELLRGLYTFSYVLPIEYWQSWEFWMIRWLSVTTSSLQISLIVDLLILLIPIIPSENWISIVSYFQELMEVLDFNNPFFQRYRWIISSLLENLETSVQRRIIDSIFDASKSNEPGDFLHKSLCLSSKLLSTSSKTHKDQFYSIAVKSLQNLAFMMSKSNFQIEVARGMRLPLYAISNFTECVKEPKELLEVLHSITKSILQMDISSIEFESLIESILLCFVNLNKKMNFKSMLEVIELISQVVTSEKINSLGCQLHICNFLGACHSLRAIEGEEHILEKNFVKLFQYLLSQNHWFITHETLSQLLQFATYTPYPLMIEKILSGIYQESFLKFVNKQNFETPLTYTQLIRNYEAVSSIYKYQTLEDARLNSQRLPESTNNDKHLAIDLSKNNENCYEYLEQVVANLKSYSFSDMQSSRCQQLLLSMIDIISQLLISQ